MLEASGTVTGGQLHEAIANSAIATQKAEVLGLGMADEPLEEFALAVSIHLVYSIINWWKSMNKVRLKGLL